MWMNLIKAGGYAVLLKEIAERLSDSRSIRARELRRQSNMNMAMGITLGVLMGAAAGVLFAPVAGRETRERIKESIARNKEYLMKTMEEKKRQMRRAYNEKTKRLQETADNNIEADKETAPEYEETKQGQTH